MIIENWDRKLAKGIYWSFLGLVFFLPLVMSTRSSEVFELPKMLFVYAMTAVICGLWAARMIVRRQILIRRTPLDIPILLFLISQMASTIYSIDPQVSWWGWYGRFHGGLWSTISYTLLYYALVSNLRNRKQETGNNEFLYATLASAAIVSVYAILQRFGIDRNFWVQDVVNRVFSSQGQPNWLAGYLVMAMPLAWTMIVNSERLTDNRKQNIDERRWLFTIYYSLFSILLLALLWTKSRSGLIGLTIMDIVFWGLLILKGPALPRQGRAFIKPLLLVHCFLLLLIFLTNNPVRDGLFQKAAVKTVAVPALEGEITIRKSEHGGTESGDIRRLVWTGAIQLVKQRPIFGFGPETFGETYWRVRPKEHNLTSEWNFLYNKAHNEWLNLAANTGLFGLGAHLLLLGWFSIWVLKGPALPRQGRALSSYAIIAALLGVEVVNFFGFSTVTVGVYRYLFMGLAVAGISDIRNHKSDKLSLRGASATKQSQQDCHAPLRQGFVGLAMTGGLVVAVFYLLFQILVFFWADLEYNRGRAYADGGYVEEAMEPLMRAVNWVPGEPVFRAELGETGASLAATLLSRRDPSTPPASAGVAQDDIEPFKEAALVNFEIVRKQSPENLGFVRTEARVMFLLGEEDRAVQLMKVAIEMAPTNPQLPYSLGTMLTKMGQDGEAAVYYNKAVELKSDYAIPISE